MNSNPSSYRTADSANLEASPETISRRAYELWEEAGKPEGTDLQHWLQAEKEMSGQSQNSSDSAAPIDLTARSDRDRYTDQQQASSRPSGAGVRESKRSSANPFGAEKRAGTQTTTQVDPTSRRTA